MVSWIVGTSALCSWSPCPLRAGGGPSGQSKTSCSCTLRPARAAGARSWHGVLPWSAHIGDDRPGMAAGSASFTACLPRL